MSDTDSMPYDSIQSLDQGHGHLKFACNQKMNSEL